LPAILESGPLLLTVRRGRGVSQLHTASSLLYSRASLTRVNAGSADNDGGWSASNPAEPAPRCFRTVSCYPSPPRAPIGNLWGCGAELNVSSSYFASPQHMLCCLSSAAFVASRRGGSPERSSDECEGESAGSCVQ
jgi:hypothetical protein